MSSSSDELEEGPFLDETQRVLFPGVKNSTPEGIVAVGGNLSAGFLLSAYEQGIFPWFNEGEPVIWWSPNPRCILFPKQFHLSKRMKRTIRSGLFSFSVDQQFEKVMHFCGSAGSRKEKGSWVSSRFIEAYTYLHQLGIAHSVEVWSDGELVGGLYGVQAGVIFCGESMFSLKRDASKAAFWYLCQISNREGIELIDCQLETSHLVSLGAERIEREIYLSLLQSGLKDYGELKGGSIKPKSWIRDQIDILGV